MLAAVDKGSAGPLFTPLAFSRVASASPFGGNFPKMAIHAGLFRRGSSGNGVSI